MHPEKVSSPRQARPPQIAGVNRCRRYPRDRDLNRPFRRLLRTAAALGRFSGIPCAVFP